MPEVARALRERLLVALGVTALLVRGTTDELFPLAGAGAVEETRRCELPLLVVVAAGAGRTIAGAAAKNQETHTQNEMKGLSGRSNGWAPTYRGMHNRCRNEGTIRMRRQKKKQAESTS